MSISFYLAFSLRGVERVFCLVLEKHNIQNPDAGTNTVVITEKHSHHLSLFHIAVSYIQRKMWFYEKYRKYYYRIVVRLFKCTKKDFLFFIIIFLCL